MLSTMEVAQVEGHQTSKKVFADFSIQTLLKKEYKTDRGKVRYSTDHSWDSGESGCPNPNLGDSNSSKSESFSWLNCTRFKPPKLTRLRKKHSSKRNGRGPRIPFSTHQLAVLERTFLNSQYLSSKSISNLAENLQLTEVRVKIWFQNRRARYRRENASLQVHSDTAPVSGSGTEVQLTASTAEPVYLSPPIYHQHLAAPSDLTSQTVPTLNKQSFRHLINELNLLTANANGNR